MPTGERNPTTHAKGEAVKTDSRAIFASTTDEKGVIRGTNLCFQTISEYSERDLTGAPHKIVRHPDMPRGLYYLLWERLKAGKPCCSYIKNRTASDGYYWVFATLTRSPDGYFSVRVSPGTPHRDTAEEVFAKLKSAEQAGMKPEESAALLLKELKDRGHSSYDAYMSTTLQEELNTRDDLPNEVASKLEKIDKLYAHTDQADDVAESILSIFKQVRGEPVNLQILSGRMEEAGAAIATISRNYDSMATDTFSMIERLSHRETGNLSTMRAAIAKCSADIRMAALCETAVAQAESGMFGDEAGSEMTRFLSEQAEHLYSNVQFTLTEVASLGLTIPETCRQLRRRMNGLDLVKLLCRVESGRISDGSNGMNGIISRLEDAHTRTYRHIADLSNLATQINAVSRAI